MKSLLPIVENVLIECRFGPVRPSYYVRIRYEGSLFLIRVRTGFGNAIYVREVVKVASGRAVRKTSAIHRALSLAAYRSVSVIADM